MVIHEVIYFSHELDMLEAHLEEHQHFVDKFFLKESPVWWSGLEKPLIFDKNRARFSRFNIEYMMIPSNYFDLSIPRSFPKEEFKKWFDVRRNNRHLSRVYRWEDISKGSDYVMSMDCDEIIDSRRYKHLTKHMKSKQYEHLTIKIQQSQYWVNCPGRKLDLYRVFRGDIPYRATVKHRPRWGSEVCIGWHFTNCYSPEEIRMKATGITTHYGICGVDNVPSTDEIEKSLKTGHDPFLTRWSQGKLVERNGLVSPSRVSSKVDRDWAPKFIRENPDKFPWYEEDNK
jgi:hypothetical protein